MHHLQRDATIELGIEGREDRSHPAGTELLEHDEPPPPHRCDLDTDQRAPNPGGELAGDQVILHRPRAA